MLAGVLIGLAHAALRLVAVLSRIDPSSARLDQGADGRGGERRQADRLNAQLQPARCFATFPRPGSPRRGANSSAVPIGNVIETPGPEQSASLARSFARVLATAGGVGLVPLAPGTVASAVAVLLFLPLSSLPVALYGLTVIALAFLGIWAAEEAERAFAQADDPRIVIDEVAGQLIALAPLLWLGRERGLPWLVTGFVLFRVLDVWKPGFVGYCERRFPGGTGVMLDDVLAGILAGLMLWLAVLRVDAWT